MAAPRIPKKKHVKIHELAGNGESTRQIAKQVGIHHATVSAYTRKPLVDPADPTAALPPSWAEEYPPFSIDGAKKALLLFDVHIPFHDRGAIEAAIGAGRAAAVDTVVLGGDALDFHSVSRSDHDGSKLTYHQEIEYARQFLVYLRGRFPKARIVFKEGNHEERLTKYILSRAPALFGLENCTLASLVGLANIGAELVSEQRVMRLGKLRIIHGHEYGGGVNAPVNAARWLLLRAKRAAVMGHLHHTSEQPDTDIDGEVRAAWSVGCLCGLHPKYRRLNSKWNHGAAIVEVARDGDFNMRNFRIRNGKVM